MFHLKNTSRDIFFHLVYFPLHSDRFHHFANFLVDIHEICTKDWNISFHHILYEGNQCVDLLAKFEVNGAEPLVVVHEPLLYFHRYACGCFGIVSFLRD